MPFHVSPEKQSGPRASLADMRAERRRRGRYIRLSFLFIAVFLIFVGFAWLILRSSVLHFNTIQVSGVRQVSEEDVLAFLESRVVRDSWIRQMLGFTSVLVWPDAMSGDDLQFFPIIKSLEIDKRYRSRTLTIDAVEREPFGIWCTHTSRVASGVLSGESCWWFDAEGVLFKPGLAVEGNPISVLHDYTDSGLGLGYSMLPERFIGNMFSIFRVLSESGLSIREVRLEDLHLQEVKALTNNGPVVYFSLRFPADNTLDVIRSIRSKERLSNLEYIDFRVENRAYYR